MVHHKTTQSYSFLALLLLLVTTQVFAAPRPINYQGYLTQPNGTPIDAIAAMEVGLWTSATAGTLLYSESHATVTISGGRFSIEISTGTPISGAFNADQFQQDTWLELTINGELLSPRTRLGAVAGSQHAEIAERLSTSCSNGQWIGFRDGALNCFECEKTQRTTCYDGPSGTAGIGQCHTGQNFCVDGAYGACTAQGLPEAEICDSLDNDCNGLTDEGDSLPGCVDMYIDTDGDGFGDTTTLACYCSSSTPNLVSVDGDCDVNDNDVRPDQTLFFPTPSNSGTFDYNCNGVVENKKSLASCTYNGSSCDYVPGFVSSLPACGQWETHSAGCIQDGSNCTVSEAGLQRMSCR